MSDTRQTVHELVDQLPDEQIPGLLEHLRSIADPAAEALRNAPLDDEEETEEESEAVNEAHRWLEEHGGKGVPHSQAMRDLGLE